MLTDLNAPKPGSCVAKRSHLLHQVRWVLGPRTASLLASSETYVFAEPLNVVDAGGGASTYA
jgi:hypothetical protein